MKTLNLLSTTPTGIIDHKTLQFYLESYSDPNGKISRMVKNGELIRIKKGIYALGKRYLREFNSYEILSNILHGPSYISHEYALAYYGLIPEKVVAITASVLGLPKTYHTPLGTFIYKSVPSRVFYMGIRQEYVRSYGYLMASPEKAVADRIWKEKPGKIRSLQKMEEYCFEWMRFDEDRFASLDADLLMEIAQGYRSETLETVTRLLKKIKEARYE